MKRKEKKEKKTKEKKRKKHMERKENINEKKESKRGTKSPKSKAKILKLRLLLKNFITCLLTSSLGCGSQTVVRSAPRIGDVDGTSGFLHVLSSREQVQPAPEMHAPRQLAEE